MSPNTGGDEYAGSDACRPEWDVVWESTDALAKCMIRINGQTLLERTVEALKLAGISKMVIVVG